MEKKEKRRRSFRHLNQFDRDRIEALKKAGHNQKDIALVLKVNESCISREINQRKRKDGTYCAKTAGGKAQVRRGRSRYQGMKIEKYPKLKEYIIRGLVSHRSPDEIAGRMKKEKLEVTIGTNAIYKWLYSAYGQYYCKYLCTQRYRKRKQRGKTKRGMIPHRISLNKRPKEGQHAEGDLFVSPRRLGTTKSGALVCVPSCQLLLGKMIKNKKPATMERAMREVLPKISITDLTLDNGIENRYHQRFGVSTYFADPYSPWQKAHVENNIGLLRRWFIPKRTNLENIPEEALQAYLHVLNGKHRKSLGYRSAYEVALESGIIQKIPNQKVGISLRKNVKKIAFH